MADVSKIKTPDNTTYNIKDVEGRKEENLVWGGTNKVGEVSPIGMSLSNEHSANRLAYINGDSLYFEYSSNSGSTWTSYDYSASLKSQFCTLSYQVPIGRSSSSTDYSTSSRTRITLTAQNGTTAYVYTNPRKMLINISSSGGMQVLVEYRTGTNYQSGGAWNTFGTYNLSGWSGWNDIPLILGTLGGGSTQTGNNWQLRLTFIMTSFNSSYPTTAFVQSLRIYGENGWGVTSNLGATGHLYSYDSSQNAIFPANVQIKNGKQVGWLSATPTSGQVIVADGTDGGIKTSGYTIAKSIPSNAALTDANVTQTETSATTGTHEILFSGTGDNVTRTEGTCKSQQFRYANATSFSWTDWAGGQYAAEYVQPVGQLYIGTETCILGNGNIFANDSISTGSVNTNTVTCNSMSVQDISTNYTPAKTSGNWSIGSDDGVYRIYAYRTGNVIQFAIALHGNGTAVSAGNNGFVGSISGGALPIYQTTLVGMYSSSSIMASLGTNGSLTVRPFQNTTLTSTSRLYITGTFICA